MSRISRGSLPAGRNAPAGAMPVPSALFRRGKSLAGVYAVDGEEMLDLFSSARRGYSISSSSGESDMLNKMGRKTSIGLTRAGRGAADELLVVEVGKHDYDWLLTPPGTPIFSSVDSTNHQPPSTPQRSISNLRPASLVKTSRPLVPHSENNSHGPKASRSSSTARASSTTNRMPSSVLNTSTASVNSRPTTPNMRTRAPAAVAAAPRPTASRSTTPARTRPSPIEKPKPVTQTSRPLTPNSRSHIPPSLTINSGLNSTQIRPTSRSSTPTRRIPPPVANSRPSSPVSRSRTPVQPIIPPDFPMDAPPNLRTKLPERAISAGRQRPGMALTARGNSNIDVRGNSNVDVAVCGLSSSRRASSPAESRGRFSDNQAKGRANGSRDNPKLTENQKPMAPERKLVRPSPGGEMGSYGRTMSKNSLNMALKHMDIRQGAGGVRGASLFPHSVRSTAAPTLKERATTRSEPVASPHNISEYDCYNNKQRLNNCIGSSSDTRDGEMIRYCEAGTTIGSSRYDLILLKEDSGSLNWLRGLDDKPDNQSHPFDRSRFDPLPEPFILL